jgi:hypothetical protein
MRKRPMRWISIGLGLLLLLSALTVAARAQSGGGYDLSWSTIDGGGGSSSGGQYALTGTIGQADAGAASGGSYTLSGGFWGGAVPVYKVYVPLVLKSVP